jgi:hypothetical protein
MFCAIISVSMKIVDENCCDCGTGQLSKKKVERFFCGLFVDMEKSGS